LTLLKFLRIKLFQVRKVNTYLSITINDEADQFGNQGPVIVQQTKEEREAKVDKVYLGNVKVVWTNGDNVAAAQRDGGSAPVQQAASIPAADDDLPF